MTHTETTLYFTHLASNPSNSDTASLADGWPVSVRILRGTAETTVDPETSEEVPTGNYIYPDPLAGEIVETKAEHDARKADAVRVTHNDAVAAAKAAIPNWPLTRRQLRLALQGAGIDEATINTAIDAAPNSTQVRIYWEDTNDFQFNNALVLQFSAVLGIDEATRTAIWHAAKDL